MDSSREKEIVILSGARTPSGRFMGALSSLRAPSLGAAAIEAAVDRSGVDPASIAEVIMGLVISAGVGQAPARQAALRAGLPTAVGATAVNKVCGSGLKAVMIAANVIAAEEAEFIVAGGMESMSNVPYLLPKARQGLRYGPGVVEDAILHDGLWCSFQDWLMGSGAEFIAEQFDVSRHEMDAYALRSHEKAAAATAAGAFTAEIVPVEIVGRKGDVTHITADETIRAAYDEGQFALQTSLEQLANLPPAFAADGRVTAGNAPGLNDGAAALLIANLAAAQRHSLQPLARIAGYSHAAVDPQWIFAAPARSIPKLLKKIGWTAQEVDLFELNEAFAAQVLANGVEMRQQGLAWEWDKVNVNGGAIALGHPIGASGARILVTLLHALQQRGLKRGVAALCLGGGEAVAMAIERV